MGRNSWGTEGKLWRFPKFSEDTLRRYFKFISNIEERDLKKISRLIEKIVENPSKYGIKERWRIGCPQELKRFIESFIESGGHLREKSYLEILLDEISRDEHPQAILEIYTEDCGSDLDEEDLEFLKNLKVMTKEDFKDLMDKGLDLGEKDDPRVSLGWTAIIPRFLYKLMHMFGYPTFKISGDMKSWFTYFFYYKGHIISIGDWKGSLFFRHWTPCKVGKSEETPPQEKAEEVLDEFIKYIARIVFTTTPLNFSGGTYAENFL